MEITLANAVQCVTIAGALLTLVTYLLKNMIVKPLQTAFETLKDAVKELKEMLSSLSAEQKEFGERLVAVESSGKSAHHRLDAIERRLEHDSQII